MSDVEAADEDVTRLMKLARRLEQDGRTIAAELTYSAASEIARIRAARVWQPIETAPRDGTLKLFYCPAGSIYIAPDVEPEQPSREERLALLNASGTWPNAKWNATHFMPLPSPPETP